MVSICGGAETQTPAFICSSRFERPQACSFSPESNRKVGKKRSVLDGFSNCMTFTVGAAGSNLAQFTCDLYFSGITMSVHLSNRSLFTSITSPPLFVRWKLNKCAHKLKPPTFSSPNCFLCHSSCFEKKSHLLCRVSLKRADCWSHTKLRLHKVSGQK